MNIPGIVDLTPVGRGGFAVVYRGRQPAFGRDVAVKVVVGGGIDEAVSRRFERECQTLGALSDHPNIVNVYDAGKLDTGEPYLVMSFLDGGSYQDVLDKQGPLPWPDALVVIKKIGSALRAAHDAQIVHCDVKPANILRSRYGEPQLADFGIARLASSAGASTSMMAFTPNFVAPEVFGGADPEPRRDLYALAATFAALVRGQPPFGTTANNSVLGVMRAVLEQPPPDLRPLGVPDHVSLQIERALAKAPEDRFADMAAFLAALDATPAPGPPPGPQTGPAPDKPEHGSTIKLPPPSGGPPTETANTDPPKAVPKPWYRRRSRLLPIGLAAAVLIGAGAVALFGGDTGSPPDTTLAIDETTIAAVETTVPFVDTTTGSIQQSETTGASVSETTQFVDTTSPSVVPPSIVATVVRTCGTSGAGDCFVSVRRAPSSTSAELARLAEGDTTTIVCQVLGERVVSSLLGRGTTLWSGTEDGSFITSAFLEGDGLDPFTKTLPSCP